MKKKNILHIIAKVLFSAILLMPILGLLGIFPEPTREMYTSDASFNFIHMIMNEAGYIGYMMLIVHVIAFVALWTRRETLAVLIELPIIANVIGFHAFLDGGLFTPGAVMADVYLLLALYLLYYNRKNIMQLFEAK